MRLAQRLKKLEKTIGRLKQVEAASKIERTDEEEADRTGEFLWLQTEMSKKYPSTYSSWAPSASADPLHAWKVAAGSAWQEGHRKYHVGLRPYAMAVWLKWKPRILSSERAHRDWVRVHGEWVWDVPPLRHTVTTEQFKLLPVGEKIRTLRDNGKGHRAKDRKRSPSRVRR